MGFFDAIKEAAVDTASLAATTAGAAASATGHAVAGAACAAADVATLGMVDSIGDAKDHHFGQAADHGDNFTEGFKSFWESNENFRSDPTDADADWMGSVPDDTPITAMFIPGTHESAALVGGDLAECQCWDLQQQLASGLRAFDIRVNHDGDELPCYHGIIQQNSTFPEVAQILESFLTEHPTEALFMRIRREGESGDHCQEFTEAVMACFGNEEMWNRGSDWGALSDYRGKCTFLAQGSHMRLFRQELDVQDLWETGDDEDKLAAIQEHAVKDRQDNTMYLSYCSATGGEGLCYKGPAAMAYQVNGKVAELCDSFLPGIYMFDYPGVALVEKLLAKNPTA
eukprot:TRINITY_DN37694_c0_g1_i1.p1 TRINITY_DN37694_c0_g1~~TRINITY_DN37694_c0_g1_i1.p1  ORF type:complete len:342 (+),score=60.07 TRINITY_DN37694_c0_g1_i1:105-1130(+)